jgi:endonuclease/exonuclease/phosphatase family metal-dependent hydrolase
LTLEHRLSVATWNLSYELLTPPGVLPWNARRDRIAELLRDFDVVALQELSGRQLSDLTERLPGFAVVSDRSPMPEALHAALSRRMRVDLEDRELGELALLVRSRRSKVTAHGTSWLSPTPEVPLSVGWGNEIPRQVLWATVRDLGTGDAWLAATTHIDLTAVRPMLEAVREQLATLVAGSDGAVLMGDLNTIADPDAYRVLLDADWRDTHPTGDLATDPTFLGETRGRPARIDHILVTGRGVGGEWRRLPDRSDGLSDHLAVAASIGIAR